MPSNRKAISLLLILVLAGSAAGVIFIYRYLPVFIEHKARQVVMQNTPFTRFNVNIRHAGFYGIEVGDLEVGDKQNSALSVGSIDIRYSPTGLIQKRINRVAVEGLNLFLAVSDGQLSIPGLDAAAMKKDDKQGPAEIKIPIGLEEVKVKKSILHLTVDGERLLVPFNLTLTQDNSGQPSHYEAILHIYPGPEQAGISADIDLADNRALLRFTSESLLLDKFAALISTFQDAKVTGRATIDAVSEMKLQPPEIVSAGVDITLQPFSLGLNNVRVESQKKSPDDKPIKATIDYSKEKIQYKADDILLTVPIRAAFDTNGALELSGGQLAGAGDFTFTVKEIPSLKIKEHVQFSSGITYGYDRLSGNWHFNLAKSASSATENIKVQYQDILIETGVPDYVVTGKGVTGSSNVSFTTAYQQISVVQGDLKGNFSLALDGTVQLDVNGLQGQMQAKLQNGSLDFTENKYLIEDIALSVKLPALPQIRTDASQELRFSKASLGNLSITNGRVTWQLESTDSLFIENSVFQWAGGNLRVNDVRLTLGEDQQFIKILCERLDLIEILQQLGIENAEGEGTVNGEIPLLLGKNTIDFEDGLLASSQGEGGRIKIVALDLLAAGVPKNSPQFAQIDFAAEALKDFKYNWVKLILNTTGDDLVMQLQMEGRPMFPLPFAYNESGTFTRVEAGGQGIIRPIRLDVNFRFPLNRVLGYTGRIQDILDRLKQ